VGKGVGVSDGSAVSLGGGVTEGGWVSVGRGRGVEGEQETSKEMHNAKSRMRDAMGLCIDGILTDVRISPLNDKPSRNISARDVISPLPRISRIYTN
jgi:hypothetical protein